MLQSARIGFVVVTWGIINIKQVLDHARDEYLFMFVPTVPIAPSQQLTVATMQLFRICTRSIEFKKVDILPASTGKCASRTIIGQEKRALSAGPHTGQLT